jgi:hypothetical protein
VHTWAESENAQMRSARTQYLQIKQVKMKRPNNFYREHYEEALRSAGFLRGIVFPQGDITLGFLCTKAG